MTKTAFSQKYHCSVLIVLVITMLTLTFGALGTTPAYAATITVTNINDSGVGSLRKAIADAASGDTITFAAGLSGQTILLASTLTLNKSVTIDGSALAPQITISGKNAVRVFTVNIGVNATLKSLRITNGFALYGNGGGIYNSKGALVMTDITISGSEAYSGGAIYNETGTLTVTASTFIGNKATYNSSDGGGAIYNLNGTLTVINSTFSGNHATGNWGSGGGIFNNAGTANVYNSTFSGGSVGNAGFGGAIYNTGTLNYYNTILANSISTVDCYSTSVAITSISNLVESNAANPNSCNPSITGDPNLGTLASNGGSTQTLALLPGSPAIDAGDNATCSAAPVNGRDQRGKTRPVGMHCDIGAYEFGSTIAGNVGVAGAKLRYTDGTVKTAISSANGAYSFAVSYGWSGTVTPSKPGFAFSPLKKTYANVIADKPAQNYSAYAPAGTVTVMKPTYKWTKIAGATQYQYQVMLGTKIVYSKPVASSVCGVITCSNTPTTALPSVGTYKWKVRAMVNGAWKAYSPVTTFVIKPKAGYWNWVNPKLEFYIIPTQASVNLFEAVFSVCDSKYSTIPTGLLPIVNGKFSLSGTFQVNGTIKTPTTASGTYQLLNYSFPGCPNQTGGPWPWTAKWVDSSQAMVAGSKVAENLSELIMSGLDSASLFGIDPVP
jgi:hypothetical protein